MENLKIDQKIIGDSVIRWGMETQTRQVMEECAELTQACNKQLRNKRDDNHLAEEIADVAICLDMLMQMYDIPLENVQAWVNMKQERTAQRINGASN